jgi:hypothetical protein
MCAEFARKRVGAPSWWVTQEQLGANKTVRTAFSRLRSVKQLSLPLGGGPAVDVGPYQMDKGA